MTLYYMGAFTPAIWSTIAWTGLKIMGYECDCTIIFKYRIYYQPLGFFTNSPQYKIANIAIFVLAVPSERNETNEVCNL